ncbi:MAG TPA: HNH endonuclease signature motif containing protein [Acidimicrobiales bacterium]|nr:HNH endonuclease signature motif containing protein [Acidimicrobiales bacterium]
MAVIAPEPGQSDRPPTEARELFAHLDAIDWFFDAYDPDRYSAEDGAELLGRLTRHERRVVAVRTLTAARVARGNLHVRTGHRSPAEFLAAQTGDSVGEAKGLIRLGENLADQPELEESFRRGRLARRRAALVSEAARINPGKEGDLVKSAENDSDATVMERCLRAKAEGRSREDAERHRRALHEKRSARTWTDMDGALRLEARFAPEVGAELKAALEAQTERQFQRARREGRFETSDAYRADALLALVTGKSIVVPKRKGRRQSATPDHAVPIERTERAGDPNATVSVVVDLEALRRGTVGDGERCEIPGVGSIAVDHAHRLLGEALVELVIAHGVDVTTVYSAGRNIPRRVRSALLLRDPRCVVPGCDARLGLENDHWVTDFAEGGLTSLDNLARICRHHHRQRTHQGFELLRGPDGWEWIAPETPVVPNRPRPKPKARARSGARSLPSGTGPPLSVKVSPRRQE